MDGARRGADTALPRLVLGRRRATAAWNAFGLLGTATLGAALVHLLAYHVPLGVPVGPRWIATALTLLAHCPLNRPLGLVAVVAIVALLVALHEFWRLERLTGTLDRLLAVRVGGGGARRAVRRAALPMPMDAPGPLPRSPWRLAAFFVGLLTLQMAILAVAALLYPMRMTMVMGMGDGPMTMPIAPTLPLAPLHLLVALGLALVLWRVERRLNRLRVGVARRLRLLDRPCGAVATAPPIPRGTYLPLGWCGLTLFARPPPRYTATWAPKTRTGPAHGCLELAASAP